MPTGSPRVDPRDAGLARHDAGTMRGGIAPSGTPLPERAGPVEILTFTLGPIVLALSLVAWGPISSPTDASVPLLALAGLGCLLLVSPLSRRSDGFRIPGYRQAAELAFAGFLTSYLTIFYLSAWWLLRALFTL